jgi:transcriptional regulator GlxA family with amidase domain
MPETLNVAVLIFPDVDILDFCGPFEVFAVAARWGDPKPFNVYTIAENPEPLLTRGGLNVIPTYTLDTCPRPDLLVVPGGLGSRKAMVNPKIIGWIQQWAQQSAIRESPHEGREMLLSVCTGALILGKAGLLDGLKAATHHLSLEELAEAAPNTEIIQGVRYVDNGRLITSAGISAGIDMSLHVVARLLGEAHAQRTAKQLEYEWESSQQPSQQPVARS